MTPKDTNGWNEWKNHVLVELERYGKSLDAIHTRIDKLNVEVGRLGIKSSLWGGIAGIVGAGMALVLMMLKGLL